MNKQNLRREFVSLMKDTITKHPPAPAFLEYMVGVFNSANREQDYCETLIRLFALYYAGGNFLKAADSLERAIEVDPYTEGNQKNLEMLRGKIDQQRYNAIANRLTTVGAKDDAPSKDSAGGQESFDKEPTVLEDFMLQAEIFIQYSMRSKAVERLERVNKLFPHEEDKNEKLRNLYMNAGFVPKYEKSTAEASGTPSPSVAPSTGGVAAPLSPFGQTPSYGGGQAAAVAQPTPTLTHDENAVDNFGRVT